MNRLARIFGTVVLAIPGANGASANLITPPATLTGTNLPGRTPGALRVNSAGQATYTIPIAVPPGTNRMVPNLALVYSGDAPNGPIGMGWSVADLNQITRCARD